MKTPAPLFPQGAGGISCDAEQAISGYQTGPQKTMRPTMANKNSRLPTSNDKPRPPANALRVNAWRDLPSETEPATYEVKGKDGTSRAVSLSKGNRIVLDALIDRPIFCASPIRISSRVCVLRHDFGVPIKKEMYDNDTTTDRAKFGAYFLDCDVKRISDECEVA